ncbi:hypothetical protein Purlil1_12325 [Purpureocillium lilacinum]|uniref:Uncharacterized protein n=1 Tax=Purpureocillium lilacinum TaxID=33203 RepID=A0ABR0BI93_PURLI|nr:hypothetical protein Purlil1_12325 [Purpureocillium lilacinum]
MVASRDTSCAYGYNRTAATAPENWRTRAKAMSRSCMRRKVAEDPGGLLVCRARRSEQAEPGGSGEGKGMSNPASQTLCAILFPRFHLRVRRCLVCNPPTTPPPGNCGPRAIPPTTEATNIEADCGRLPYRFERDTSRSFAIILGGADPRLSHSSTMSDITTSTAPGAISPLRHDPGERSTRQILDLPLTAPTLFPLRRGAPSSL